MYCPCAKIHKPWLMKEDILCIIEADFGEIGLCHKNNPRVPFFDYLQQNATHSSLIHDGLIQYLHILYPDMVNTKK